MSGVFVVKRIVLIHGRMRSSLPNLFNRRYGLVSRHWERKRFYQETSVYKTEDDDGYGVCLDQRRLRTPLRKVFSVPTESLAVAVAEEWRTQGNVIQPALMHLTALCNTVIDNPLNKTQEQVVSQAIQYLSSDTVCFRSDTDESLFEAQAREWDPMVNWFNERFSGNLVPTVTLSLESAPSVSLCDSLAGYLKQLSMWSLIGFSHSLDSTSSVVLTSALMEEKISPLQASNLTQLEMQHQVSRWGNVEWQHDVEASDLLSRLSASLLLSRLSNI